MDEAIIACRAVLFVSVMLAFGASAFRLYAAAGSDPGLIAALDAQSRDLLLVSAIVGLLSALMLVPLVGGQMAGSMTATFEWTTISTVLLKTSFGRVWRWHLLIALLLVVACAIRRVQPGYRTALAGLSLASVGLIGHATIGEGRVAFAHQMNHSVHLLAAGIWLGGLVPLGALIIQARRSGAEAWFAVLSHFSQMGYVAVALVALTGIVNTALLIGSADALVETSYGRLLLVKISLFLLLVIIAIVNHFILAPWISREGMRSTGAIALVWTIAVEQALGIGIITVVSILGTWSPPLHLQTE